MANKFWVGGSGNWNDSANHWSATSGGAPGDGVPASTDDCFFDVNSFTAGSRTITLNTSPSVKSMNFTGATNNPIVMGSNSSTIAGSLTLISGMTWNTSAASITFASTGTTCNLTTAGVTLIANSVAVNGTGTFNFQDTCTIENLSGGGEFSVSAGSPTVNTNNNAINVRFWANSAGTPTYNLGSSIITVSSGAATNDWQIGSGSTLNAGTSKINMTANNQAFAGGGKTYYDVEFTGTPTTISGANTFNSLTIAAGKRVNFPASTTQTITTLNAVGTAGNKILFRSTSAGTQASLCVTTWNIAHVDAQDINASCTTIIDCTGTDSGNNTGWNFCTGRAFLLNLI